MRREETDGGLLGSRRCFEWGVDTAESLLQGSGKLSRPDGELWKAPEKPLSFCRCVPQGLKGSSNALLISDKRVLQRSTGEFILCPSIKEVCLMCVRGCANRAVH